MISKIHPHDPEFAGYAAIDCKPCNASASALTVWKKSLVYSCDGFTVFDSSGNLVFRVDNYPSDPKDEVVLMDAAGMAILTMRRKRLSLQTEWQGFFREFRDAPKPLFVVRKASSLRISRKNLAEVYMRSSEKSKKNKKSNSDYRVQGSYAKRSFTLLNSFNEVVAEVKPKQGIRYKVRRRSVQSDSAAWLQPSFRYGVDYYSRSDHAIRLNDHRLQWVLGGNREGICFRLSSSLGIGRIESGESHCAGIRYNSSNAIF